MLAFEIRETGQSSYMRHAVQSRKLSRTLRKSDEDMIAFFDVRLTTSNFTRQSFSFVVPTVWNKLPSDLRRSPKTICVVAFGKQLKTILFKSAYGHW